MSIASKNLFDLLGNDPELDPNREPEPPTKAIDKPTARTGKRNAPTEAPARSAGAGATTTRAPKDSANANDNYLRDRNVGSDKNRSRGSGEPGESGYRGDRGGRGGRARGGRGGRGGRGDGDRHSKSGQGEHQKQADAAWGGPDGNAELADEQAGETIAKQDEKAAVVEDSEPQAEPEPEDKTMSYNDYLAELAAKKLATNDNVRKPNEGASKKFPEGTAITRQEQEEFMSGSGGKAKRQRERKEKAFVELDGDRMLAQPARDDAPRGGRGGRGGRGRGEGRGGGEGRGEGRGEYRGRGGRGRGEGRGDGPREHRGGRGGPRGGGQSGPNLADSSAFPSLGS